MLESLQIRNYVLIDSLDVEFPEGLIIISGQTGAGKSILLGALSLLLGAKADAAVIGENADSCVVEAVFRIPESDLVLKGILDGNEVDADDGRLIVRRVVNRSGRTRSFINDSPVSVQVLQSISSRLVDIHSQHQTLLLTDKAFQLSLLDHFAGCGELLKECSGVYRSLKALEKEHSEVSDRLSELNEEKEYVRVRCGRLKDACLKEGEIESLEVEQKQLANAEEIKQSLTSVEELFCPSDPNSEVLSVASSLKEAQKLLRRIGRFVPEVNPLADRIEAARAELEDILEEVTDINARKELSRERLDTVEGRLSLLYDLLKSYSASSVSELIAERDRLAGSLCDSAALEVRKGELETRISRQRLSLDGICRSLHELRSKAAGPFASAVTDAVRSLELERAVFSVELSGTAELSEDGADAVRFLFSASGSSPIDVGRCASGGEMSRLMLCLKALMAGFVNMPTLVFDEIDTGVSGSVADKMGSMICSMGRDMQVFAITHLPQVAAKGNAHYVVEKEYDVLGKATATVRQLSGEGRVMEIARMLSGSSITKEAVENAKSLLAI